MLSEDEKTIQFYKRFIETEEQELEWMYKEDEEYYRDSIEQKELLIKGWRNISNLITKLQKENEELKEIKNIADTKITDLRKIKDYDKLQSKIWILQTKLKEKDKQIDLMSDYIREDNNEEKYCIGRECNKEANCKICIKQYFEKSAKEKGEIK